MTLEVIIGIHWQAVKLWWKRIPIFDHPANAARSDTGTASRSAAENKEI
jgi:DUF1365 family protein